MRRVPSGGALALALAAALFAGDRAKAGDRQLYVQFVNMTPDAVVTPASRICVREIDATIRKGYTDVRPVGERATRTAAGKLDGSPILEWPASALLAVAKRADPYIDALILVDCRPEARTLDVVVYPASSAVARLQLRGVPIDARAARLMGERLLVRAWAGFSP